ncbi:MAG: hypothetical protein TR69_WS6001000041 [candidate division WS6 bacterium OLB20]|uniref:Zeta toxin n=1 Tax=candidate division WS6 bacterium OLB20 TaxID=1617426 RepID=A0A136M141_9BACT|nr:MAG: hypothetical protein TR69_WS6001000041 [candidate division WS6 bacterium OLB20]
MKDNAYTNVILLACGAASGKSEYLEYALSNVNSIIYDSTLSALDAAKIKVRNSLKKKKNVKLVCVIPDSLYRSFLAFINRERQYPVKRFFATHAGCRSVVLTLLSRYPEIEIEIIESYTEDSKIRFRRKEFANRIEVADYLQGLQMTSNQIEKQIQEHISNEI